MEKAFLFLLLAIAWTSCNDTHSNVNLDWPGYLGGPETNQFGAATQINRENVSRLSIAWIYNSGGADTMNRTQIQCNPLIIDGILYGSSPTLQFFALEADSGRPKWTFNPYNGTTYEDAGGGVSRGMAYWTDGKEKRLFSTAGSEIFCLNAETGTLITTFGNGGKVDLHDGLGRAGDQFFINSHSPGIVYQNLLIQGCRTSESTGAAPGHIRAYDIITGDQVWIFRTIPYPDEPGYETWPEDAWKRIGGANAWAGFSLDEDRGIVYVPTGSAAFDFYGGDREGQNLYANCLLALDAETGKRIWHYQFVHHDIWDRDLPCPPNLVTVTIDGQRIDAVAQVTKSSRVFVFDRVTGEPLFPIEEVGVPASDLQGEKAWPTQPIPSKPPQFSRGMVSEESLTQRTPEAHQYALSVYKNVQNGSDFIPPSEMGSFILPGLDGGGEWGGAAVDPNSGIMYVNASEMAWILQMIPFSQSSTNSLKAKGKQVYRTHCQICHGSDFQGMAKDVVPSLVNLKDRLDQSQVMETIYQGKGAMPVFAHLSEQEIEGVSAFLLDLEDEEINSAEEVNDTWPYPYYLNGYRRFNDPDGYPAISPPWGTLNAIDLNQGEIIWKVPLGDFEEMDYPGHPVTGTENYGGPLITQTGLLFIAATKDKKFRAFDTLNGELLWEMELPAAGFATPSTYMVNGKQYIVIACGGGKIGMPSGDAYVAFSL